MHIGHAQYYLYKYTSENKIKTTNQIFELLKEVKDYFELLEDAYYNKNIKAIHKINNLKNRFQFGKCLELISKAKGKEGVVYSYIKDIFRLIQIGTSPILAEILEKQI